MKTMKSEYLRTEAGPVEGAPQMYAAGSAGAFRVKKRRVPKYLKVLAAGLGLYLAALFCLGVYQMWDLKKQINTLEAEQRGLLEQQQRLKEEMNSLNSPQMIERIARESLRMVKPGETVIIPAYTGDNPPTY